MRGPTLIALGLMLPLLAAAAAPAPSALRQAMPGLWEVSGAPGTKAPVRQCAADIATLAQYEHRASSCTHSIISDGERTSVIQYSCGGAGFGRSDIHLITPRSLKISTQGISDQLPFNYVLQAHRVGDCTKTASPPRH
jgi:hypothetical protein